MEQVQMNTRIGVEIKRTGDEVLRRYGFMPSKIKASDLEARKQEVVDNAGFAMKELSRVTGIPVERLHVDSLTDDELRELAWRERGVLHD